MLSYHNNPALKEEVLARLQQHYDADEIIGLLLKDKIISTNIYTGQVYSTRCHKPLGSYNLKGYKEINLGLNHFKIMADKLIELVSN